MAVYCDKCNNILDITRTVPKPDLFDGESYDTVSSISKSEDKTNKNISSSENVDQSDQSSQSEQSEQSDKSDKSDKSNESGSEDLVSEDSEDSENSEDLDSEASESGELDARNNAKYEEILKKLQTNEQLTEDELKSIDMKEIIKTDYYKKMNGKGQIKTLLINMIDDLSNSDNNTKVYHICNNCLFHKSLEPGFHVLSKNPEGVVSSHDYENEEIYKNMVYQRTKPRTRAFKCPNKSCPSVTGSKPSEACFFRKPGTYELIYVCTLCHTIKRI